MSQATKPIQRFKILSDNAENTGLHTGELDSANCVETIRIAEELNNNSLLSISYNFIGEYVSRIKGDNTNGLEYYFKAIPLAEKSKDKRHLVRFILIFRLFILHFKIMKNL